MFLMKELKIISYPEFLSRYLNICNHKEPQNVLYGWWAVDCAVCVCSSFPLLSLF